MTGIQAVRESKRAKRWVRETVYEMIPYSLPAFNDLVEKVPNKVEHEMNQGKIMLRNHQGKTAQQGLGKVNIS